MFGYARPRGSEGQYPWDLYREDLRVFVELRLKNDENTPLPPPKPVTGSKQWKTPTPAELLRFAR